MNPYPRLLLAAATVFAAVHASVFAAAPKIEASIVGPVGQGGHYVISARGAHIGYAGAKGGKFSVTVDGVAGPEFDELLRTTGQPVLFSNKTIIRTATQAGSGDYNDAPIVFSVDGEHHAYLGRQGTDLVVIHDGKEIGRAPQEKFTFAYGPLTISPGGKHVFWVETDGAQPQPLVRLMMTGKPGPWATGAGTQTPFAFSADESRFAAPFTTRDTKKMSLIVDGKDAGYAGQNPAFTADGKLLISAGSDGAQRAVLVDGKPIATGVRIGRIFVAPAGRRWGAIVFRKNATHHDVTALIIDGKEVPEAENVQSLWFSPDGKHYAAACHHYFNRGPDYMVVDGKRSAEFKNVPERDPFWSPDSSTLIYAAMAATEPVIVVSSGGKETTFSGTLIGEKIAFADQGGRYAFTKRDPRNQIAHIVDGQELAASPAPVTGSFAFSADGSRFGYLADQKGTTATLVVDGAPVPGLTAGFLPTWSNSERVARGFGFSRNGKHLAAFARDATSTNLGLWLDGKLVHPTKSTVAFPSFTPDGNHFFWAAEGPAGLVVYADGQPTARADMPFFNLMPATWDMDRAGVVTFLGADGDVVKRTRITAAPDTSVATLIANGATIATATAAPKPPVPAVANTTPPTPSAAAKPPAPAAVVTATKPAVIPTSPGTTLLTWSDLVRRPETRPTLCIVKIDSKFSDGVIVRAGTAVNILEFKPGQIVIGTTDGRNNFSVKPEETDALAVANAAWAKLTPAQRDLTYAALLQRMDLWPYQVKLVLPFELEGRKTRVGDPATFLRVEGGQLLVRLESADLVFNVQPQETDLLAQARRFLSGEASAPSRMLNELAGKLINPLDARPVTIDAEARPKYVLLYMGAGWCGPCQVFSPVLVKLLKEKSPKPADFALIYISADKTPAEMTAYATKLNIAWPTLRYTNSRQLPAFSPLFGNIMPQLVVTDRHGKVAIDSNRVGYERALAALRELL